MTREETTDEFLRAFKVCLNTAALYSKDHPYFLKSVQEFLVKTQKILELSDSVSISATASELLLDGKACVKNPNCSELAEIIHKRKIKSFQIKKGVSLQELINLVGNISLRPKELFGLGGIAKMLNSADNPNIAIEELDYSELLKNEGEEAREIWAYLLQRAVETNDPGIYKELAENFSRFAGMAKINDITEQETLADNLKSFFDFLKKNRHDLFVKCAQDLLKAFLKDKNFSPDSTGTKEKSFFEGLSPSDLTEVLLEEIFNDESFDKDRLNVFLSLYGQEKNKEIASRLCERIQKEGRLKDGVAYKRVKELFSSQENEFMSEVYRNSIGLFAEDISFQENLNFDRHQLSRNYRMALLELLLQVDSPEKINLVFQRISEEFEAVIADNDLGYLNDLVGLMREKKEQDPVFKELSRDLDIKIADFLETAVWRQEDPAGLEPISRYISASSKWPDYYLAKIFKEELVRPEAIRLFFRFFHDSMPLFLRKMEEKSSDPRFIARLIDSLKDLPPGDCLEILKDIYNTSGKIIKIEALKAMRSIDATDADFLLSIIGLDDFDLKKQAMAVLGSRPESRQAGLSLLFSVRNHFGLKNGILLDNLVIVDELELRDAEHFVASLSKKKLFWFRPLRKKARLIMDKWHERKD